MTGPDYQKRVVGTTGMNMKYGRKLRKME